MGGERKEENGKVDKKRSRKGKRMEARKRDTKRENEGTGEKDVRERKRTGKNWATQEVKWGFSEGLACPSGFLLLPQFSPSALHPI